MSDDFDSFMNSVEEATGSIELKPPTWMLKSIHCFMCKQNVVVPKIFKLKETCPDCFNHWRTIYVTGPVGVFPSCEVLNEIVCYYCKEKHIIPASQPWQDVCVRCWVSIKDDYLKKHPPKGV